MPRRIALALPLALPLLFLGSACQSSGYARAGKAADKAEDYRDDLMRLREQVASASEALRALGENPGDSPRSNQGTFQTFERELANLEDTASRAREDYGRMQDRAQLFFGTWNEDAARVTDADLKKSSEVRRSALQANFARLEQGQVEVEEAVAKHVQSLTDLRLYLETDLTATGIAMAAPTLARVVEEGEVLRQRLESQIRAADEAQASLEPLEDLAQPYTVTGT
jgi:DUF2959 family protein